MKPNVQVTPKAAFASNDKVHVVWWRAAPDGPGVAAWAASVDQFLASTSGPRLVTAVVQGVGPPDGPARTAMVELLEKVSREKSFPAVVVIGGGFTASLQRSAIAAVGFLARNAMPMIVADGAEGLYDKLPKELVLSRTEYDAVFAAAAEAGRKSEAA